MDVATASFVVAIASLVVALVATVSSIYAIRRDRASVRVTEYDAAAGSRYMTIVNVGLRPVRFVRVLERSGRWPWSATNDVTGWVTLTEFPLVMQPAEEAKVGLSTSDIRGEPGGGPLYLEDAAGRRHGVVRRFR